MSSPSRDHSSEPALPNTDPSVTAGFGDEWTRFDQSELDDTTRDQVFDDYFHIFPWDRLSADAKGADFGCGSGRWAAAVAPRVGSLVCLDASEAALAVARRNLARQPNCVFVHGTFDSPSVPDASLDFAYSLGVLHHVPDTLRGLKDCVRTLKPGAPMLLYLYYRFDNRPTWFRALWRCSEIARVAVSRLPMGARYLVSQIIALLVYLPLARTARLAEALGARVDSLPLAYYRDKPLYVLRTDALDRFGTRLEQRFTRREIEAMMKSAGLESIRFSERMPYWCAVGFKRSVDARPEQETPR